MTELERYLAEEIAEDHVDGIITRREAMRRLGMLGVGATAASAMIAAEAAAHEARQEQRRRSRPRARPGRDGKVTAWAPAATPGDHVPGPAAGTLLGAWAPPAAEAKGGVLVIHENRGLTPTSATSPGASRPSASALALDLLSEEGGTGAFPGDARGGRGALGKTRRASTTT